MRKRFNKHSGFTLIELLIVIVIIAILAVGAFVALDPATRFADSRDATRWTDVTAVLDAAKVDQVDNKGSYLPAINLLNDGSYYMTGTDGAGCSVSACTDEPLSLADCVDITGLATEGYLATVPFAPHAAGGTAWDAAQTGYYMSKSSTGALTVGACDSEGEGVDDISVAR